MPIWWYKGNMWLLFPKGFRLVEEMPVMCGCKPHRGCGVWACSRHGSALRTGSRPYATPAACCVQEHSSHCGARDTRKVGRATWPQPHHSPLLTDVSWLSHHAQPLPRPLGFLVNASVVARSYFKVCFRLTIIKRRVHEEFIRGNTEHSELILCLYFPFLSPSIFIMYKLISTQLIFFYSRKKKRRFRILYNSFLNELRFNRC